MSPVVLAQDVKRSQKPVAPAASVDTTNAITQAAVRGGILSCASRINQVTNFLGSGGENGTVLMTPPAQPDQRLATLSMEVNGGAITSYASANFAPNQANGCGASYDAVTWWPEKCDVVGSRQFGTFKKVGRLHRDITVLDGGAATKVFLMPAGQGCVTIKKEEVL